MKKIADFLLRKKIVVIVLAIILAAACYFLDSKVSINYNLSDYLDEGTDTKVALQIMEEKFGLTGNMQAMIPNISADEAEDLMEEFDNVDRVLNVNFDADDETYYKNGTALFLILIDGDDYSADAEKVISDVKQIVTDNGYDGVQYGGTAVEKANLKGSITKEIVYILVICIALAYVILTVTTGSWLEPILFLLTAGIAILLNRGTNLIFGEISYITNSIAAILQLALAMDYSIMLLHAYHRKSAEFSEARPAMVEAVAECLRPVSASALTTVAGLLALLFMSFTIGFDIGIVLMKGIVFSFLVAFTLFPCVIVLCAKALDKTRLGFLSGSGKEKKGRIAVFSGKAKAIVVPVFCLLIIGAYFLQSGNSYIFSDNKAANNAIVDEFGNSNTVVLVYSNKHTAADQDKFMAELAKLTNANGDPILKNYKSYSNTVLEEYDVAKASKEMDISKVDAKMLMAMYDLYQNPDSQTMTLKEFLDAAVKLATEDEDAKEMLKEEDVLTLQRLQKINDIMKTENTAGEFCDEMTGGIMDGFCNLDADSVQQIYRMRGYTYIDNPHVDFNTMLAFLIHAAQSDSRVKSMVDSATLSDLLALQAGIQQFAQQAEVSLTAEEFQAVMYSQYGMALPIEMVQQLYGAYGSSSIKLIEMLNFMNRRGDIADPTMQAQITAQYSVYQALHSKNYAYNEFLSAAASIAQGLTGTKPTLHADNTSMQQIYIMYFAQKGMIPGISMTGREFAKYTLALASENSVVANMVTDEQITQLNDMLRVYEAFSDTDKYNYLDLQKEFSQLQKDIQSYKSEGVISPDKASGVIIKNMVNSETYEYNPIQAKTLLDFVQANMDTNELLKDRMTPERRQNVADAQDEVSKATDLLVEETYSRVIMNVDLPNESEESYQFAKDVKALAAKYFGDDAHLAGEIMSVDDLRESFGHDQTLISIFTVVSILLIVLLTFRSLSIPVILVAVIQGSIWIAMSLFDLIHFDIFFMSYIVATCILMGATIDYGILLSSNYVAARAGMDRLSALKHAVATAIPTIASSGLVLMCCGFVIRLISTENSISTTGLLLGVGTLSSVIMVLFALPSVLYLCDKIILKTTMKQK